MTYKFKPGESVSHHRYPGVVGVIEAVYLTGFASVRFGDRSVYFELINLEPADKKLRDINARLERAHLNAARRKLEELERQAREKRQMLTDERRQAFLQNINLRFQCNFLDPDAYFQASSKGEISPDDYAQEKIAFLKSWFSKNTPQSTKSEKRNIDHEQLNAIAAVNGHVQVVARAGSGKTTTLVVPSHVIMYPLAAGPCSRRAS